MAHKTKWTYSTHVEDLKSLLVTKLANSYYIRCITELVYKCRRCGMKIFTKDIRELK